MDAENKSASAVLRVGHARTSCVNTKPTGQAWLLPSALCPHHYSDSQLEDMHNHERGALFVRTQSVPAETQPPAVGSTFVRALRKDLRRVGNTVGKALHQ